MKITICGSIAFYEKMKEAKTELEKIGHEVFLPPNEVEGENGDMIPVEEYYRLRKQITDNDSWVWERKEWAIRLHFEKVASSDAALVLNYEKNGIAGYIGVNTLLDAGIAFFLRKKIYLLNKVPELSYKEEILGMRPIVIDGDLGRIK